MALTAGDILFKLKADDTELGKALDNAKASFSKASKVMGAAMTAAGAAITGFVGKSVYDFAQLGDELDKMSGRTGFSTNALGELKFAAEQSGASLNDVEKASKKLSTVILEAGMGAERYNELLGLLGLTYGELAGMSPEDQFMEVAFAIADVEDASMRSALAVGIFGKSGTQLLPMLANGREGLMKMREEAVRLGWSLGDEQSKQGAKFLDTMQQMRIALGSLSLDVAQIMIPILVDLMTWVKETALSFREWREENPGLVASVVKITAAVGAVMAVLGPLLIALPGLIAAFGLVKGAIVAVVAVFGALGAAIGAPVALVVAAAAAIGAAAYGIWKDWENVKQLLIRTWEALRNAFELIFAPVIAAWKMIQSAVGYMPTGGLNQGALDRYRASQGFQASSALGGGGGGNMAAGGGPGGGVNLYFNVSGASDPAETSRRIAETLGLELRAMGLA